MSKLSTELEVERSNITELIRESFAGVSREGGISWSESDVVDGYGSEEKRALARAKDTDEHWSDVLADESWHPYPGVGGFNFLDPIGYRYYLAAAMAWSVRECEDDMLANTLTLPKIGNRSFKLGRWELLNVDHRRCVARFLRFMARAATYMGDDIQARDWNKALENYWVFYDE